MVEKNKTKHRFFNTNTLLIVSIVSILMLAIGLLWYGNATSNQATPAMLAQVYFDGEYKIADGEWHKIVEGKHISATKGDVTLRGKFHLHAPDGEYIGVYSDETPIAFYTNHINLTFYRNGEAVHAFDIENPLFGKSSCGEAWTAYNCAEYADGDIEIVVHNPHAYGNENAIDEMLSGITLWAKIDFEKGVLESGEMQRYIGILFSIVSLMFLGTAFFSMLIHIKKARIVWVLGAVVLFAGQYLTYSSKGISFWSESVVINTTMLGCSMMFYMLFLSMALVYFLQGTKKPGIITVAAMGILDALFLILPMVTDLYFYDILFYWAISQIIASIALLGCLTKEFITEKSKRRWFYLGLAVPLLAFGADIAVTALGYWEGGFASACVFMIFFIVVMIAVLKIIPQSINALTKARELETEKILLNAQLTESRVSTMMSQIRPHFIYNTLGSIEQLCSLDPPKAGELVHNFAKYLRGNFGELDNPKPILMSQEMEHVHHYISIEKVRFPDMTFEFEMNSDDFHIPALTIQPIVENAIKHGLMKLPKGGTIRVVSYETDTHYCVSVEDDGLGFDTSELFNDRKHVGIRNIRGRLKEMVKGSLEIESTIGVGTKVLITIPKEA